MKSLRWVACFVYACSLLTGPAPAAECPHGTDLDAIEAAVRSAPGCRAAAVLARACALGASGDVAVAGAVSDTCERDFLPGAGRLTRASYRRQRDACLARYRDRDGSMYRSAEAFCQATVSERFSARALAGRKGP